MFCCRYHRQIGSAYASFPCGSCFDSSLVSSMRVNNIYPFFTSPIHEDPDYLISYDTKSTYRRQCLSILFRVSLKCAHALLIIIVSQLSIFFLRKKKLNKERLYSFANITIQLFQFSCFSPLSILPPHRPSHTKHTPMIRKIMRYLTLPVPMPFVQ